MDDRAGEARRWWHVRPPHRRTGEHRAPLVRSSLHPLGEGVRAHRQHGLYGLSARVRKSLLPDAELSLAAWAEQARYVRALLHRADHPPTRAGTHPPGVPRLVAHLLRTNRR